MNRRAISAVVVVLTVLGGAAYFAFSSSDSSGTRTDAVHPPVGSLDFATSSAEDFGDAGTQAIEGRVIDAAGNPVMGAQVMARPAELPDITCHQCGNLAVACSEVSTIEALAAAYRRPELWAPLAQTSTDAQGHFRFESLPNIALKLTSRVGSPKADGSVLVELGSSSNEAVEIALKPAVPFLLRISDEADVLVPGARFTAFDHEGNAIAGVSTEDAQGVELQTSANVLWVVATHDGFLTSAGEVEPGGSVVMRTAHELVVHTVRGGKPIDAEVELSALGHAGHGHIARTQNGVVHLKDLPTLEWTLVARAPPLVSAPMELEQQGPVVELTVELEVSGYLRVTVISPAGQPVPNISASIARDDLRFLSDLTTDENGAVMLGPLPLGTYSMSLDSEFDLGLRAVSRTIEITATEGAIEIMLTPRLMATGRVLGLDGAPVAAATIELEDELERHGSSVSSEADGTFALEVEEAGRWGLAVRHSSGSAKVKTDIPGPAVDIRLQQRACVRVVASDKAGKRVPGAQVIVRDTENQLIEAKPDERGETLVCGLSDGRGDAEAFAAEHLRANQEVELKAGQTPVVRLTLPKFGTIGGVIIDEKGAPVSGGGVGEESPAVAYSESDGTFASTDLEQGKSYVLKATHPQYAASEPMTVVPPAMGLTFRVKTLPRMVGRVVSSTGPITEFVVNDDRVTDPDGRFKIAISKQLAVGAKGYQAQIIDLPELREDVGVVVLKAQQRVAGVVLDAEGQPAVGAQVSSYGFLEDVTTDAKGEFEVAVFDEWSAEVEVTAQLRRLSAHGTARGGQRITLTLSPPTQVRGVVLGADGKGRAATVFATAEQSETSTSIESGPDGRFGLELRPGVYSFSTRLNRASVVVMIQGATQEVILGAPPGSCGVLIEAAERPREVRLLPAGMSTEVEALGGGFLPGTVVLGPSARAEGIPCGQYTVIASFRSGIAQLVAAIQSADTRLTIKVPDSVDIVQVPEPEPEEKPAPEEAPK